MKCPYCNSEFKLLFDHIKRDHPKKLNYLKNHKPKIYKKLQKDLEINQMIKAKDKNLFILKTDEKTQYYKYSCVNCGSCCQEYDITIKEEDVDKWEGLGKDGFLKYIQIDPQSIATGNIELFQKLGDERIQSINVNEYYERIKKGEDITEEDKSLMEEIHEFHEKYVPLLLENKEKSIPEDLKQKIVELEKFISENHNYLGEPKVDRWGKPIEEIPFMDMNYPGYSEMFPNAIQRPHWLLPNIGHRALLSPKVFQTIREGWMRGLRYQLISELNGGCDFLNKKDNICSIHEIKPKDCKEFPYHSKGKITKTDKIFLETCKGLKLIKKK